jgi:signal transduction histidine kinase
MTTYARLTRLPRPTLGRVDLAGIVRRAAALETRLRVRVDDGPPVALEADADQLEQLFINLVRNAADAALETGGDVRVSWDIERGRVEVRVEDDGPGLADTGNLFVPFFTTKPEGSGIGLVVSRQIAEAHGGSVSLANRVGARGAVARVRLPLGARAGDGKS